MVVRVVFIVGFLMVVLGCQTSNLPKSESVEVVDQPELNEEEEKAYQYEFYRSARSRIWDLLHTKLELSFDWQQQSVFGTATLELRPYFYPQNALTLDAKGFIINSVKQISNKGENERPFQYDSLKLEILLDREYSKEEKVAIQIEYVARPADRVTTSSNAIASDQGLYFINPEGKPGKPQQIWTQGETESNSAWFPTIDSPNERCTQEMLITVDERFKTLSNGDMVYSISNDNGTRTDYWKMDKPHAPYLFMVAIGEYAKVEDTWRDLNLHYWVEPEYEDYAGDIFGRTPEMIEYFSQLFDYDFPWSKYDQVIVRDFVSGAMENTTASVFMEDLQLTRRELLDENWDYIIAHELVHQWFGDLVTCESWSNLPLNEGFANYGEYLWNEYKYGLDEAEYNGWLELQNYLAEAEEKQVPLIRYFYDDREDMFDNHSYAKAGRVLHMLRKYVGDEAFFSSLSHYLKTNAYTSVEIDDLRLSFEETTGEDLNWFFDQWFLAAGHPILEVNKTYENDSLYLYIEQIQDTTRVPVFKMPTYVDVYTGQGADSYPLLIEDVAERYSFYYEEEPKLVLFDSDRQLLGEVSFTKPAEELYYQFKNAPDFLSRYFSLYQIQETSNDSLKLEVLNAALSDSSWHIRSEAIDLIVDEEFTKKSSSLIKPLLNDEMSLVRASALSALAQSDDFSSEIFYQALNDSSYTVVGVALSALISNGSEVDEGLIRELADSKNINVLIPVADYFLSNNEVSNYDWFVSKTQELQGTDLYFFLQYFSQYLIIASEVEKKESIPVLKNLARNHNQYFVRLGAFQSLMIISDLPGVDAVLQEIKNIETDPRLIELYNEY